MSEVYEIENPTNDNVNYLTVDFAFRNSVKKHTAIEQIDKLVSLADGNPDIAFINHKPTYWEKSKWAVEEEQ